MSAALFSLACVPVNARFLFHRHQYIMQSINTLAYSGHQVHLCTGIMTLVIAIADLGKGQPQIYVSVFHQMVAA